MCCWEPSTSIGSVHNVIVNEGTCLQEFQSGRCEEGFIAIGTACSPPAPPAEGRTQALAARQKVNHRFGERLKIGADPVEDPTLTVDKSGNGVVNANPEVLHIEGGARRRQRGHAMSLRVPVEIGSPWP